MSFLSLQLVRTLPLRLFVVFSVFALASCGGGGGGGSSSNSGSSAGTTVSSDATLSALSISSGSLSSVFASGTTSYSDSVPYTVSSVTVNATTTDPNATYTVNGGSSLKVGTNNIDVIVTAQNKTTTKTYQITVTRAANNDATLSALSLNHGIFTSKFSPSTTSYSATVAFAVTSVTVSATTTDSNATYKVNGGNSLLVGTNMVDVVVTAQDGTTTKTYKITVTRAANNDANLSALSVSSGSLSSVFASGTTSYSDTVNYAVSSVTVKATTNDSNATIKVNSNTVASGAASGAIALNVGTNTVDVVVTAQDGITTKTYSISVTRQAASTDASLSALSISSGSLSSVFASGTTSYSDSLANSVTSVTVKPTTTDAYATITVNGSAVTSGTDSGAIATGVGSTTVSVVVTAQDGTTSKTYSISLNRLPALSALSLSNASLDQSFQITQLSYTSTVNFLVNATGVTATANDSGDTLKIGGVSATSGSELSPVYLATGSHNLDTVVTSGDSTTSQTYVVDVTRNATLAQQEYTAPDAATGDDFGISVAISGNTMVVGADKKSTNSLTGNGVVYVYTRSSATASWSYQTTLTATNAASSDKFGTSVAIDGDTIVVGAPYRTVNSAFGAGAVYVFTRNGSSWSQTAYIPDATTTAFDHFGISVSVSGATLVVGADNVSSEGAAYVYAYNSSTSTWQLQGTLVGSNTAASDQFGHSVAIDKDTVVVGAPQHDDAYANNDGAAYIFTRSGTTWTQSSTILSEGSAGVLGDNFGQTVAISGNTIAVGATGVNSGTGAVYVFTNGTSGWAQQGGVLTAGNPDTSDAFGYSIALSGERLVVGADQEDGDASSTMSSPNNNATDTGAVYVFMRNGSSWSQTAYLKATDAANSDYFGSSVGIDNDTLVTGARNKNVTIGGVTYNVAGAVYTFQ